jgi:AraC-like DNA-binding protein
VPGFEEVQQSEEAALPGAAPSPAEARSAFAGTLHLWPNGVFFVGADMANEPHRHFTASILLGLDGPILFRAGAAREWSTVDAVMVAPNVEQQLDARGRKLVILQIDPESDSYAGIAHHVAGTGVRVLSASAVHRLRARLHDVGHSSRAALDAWAFTIGELAESAATRRPIDPRIKRALAIMKSDFLSPPPARKLAAAVGLSPGRLIHLFTREMGLPIRRYVLWLRLRDVIFSISAGATLTEAAHHAGFSDSAHLSRTFRGMFGFPPSTIAEGRGRVRLSFDAALAQEQSSPHPPPDSERLARVAPRRSGAAGAG